MRKLESVHNVGDLRTLKKEIANIHIVFEKGDKVEIVGKGERGYDLKHVDSGDVIREAGWDLFEVDEQELKTKRTIKLWKNHTVNELKDIMENEPLSDEQNQAMKTVIELLESRL